MQTGLKSDNFCGYNQEASQFYWSFMPDQYQNTFTIGEVGVNSSGGSAGSYVRPNVIDISSFLSGRDNILSKCTPPVPALESLEQPPLVMQDEKISELLLPKYTKNLRSVNNIDSVDYNRYQPNLAVEPQNLRYVIEGFSNQRGGFNTRNYVKSAWNNQNKTDNYPNKACETTLNPSMVCGEECSQVNGYPGVDPLSGEVKFTNYLAPRKPIREDGSIQEEYPFIDITSQQINNVGAGDCGPQYFYGNNNTDGSCPITKQRMFL